MIYSITTEAERNKLAELAREVPDQGVIVEIGTLYGGIAAVFAKAQPFSAVVTIDNFSWHPENMPTNSPILVYDNLAKENIDNVTVIEGDSRIIGKDWVRPIDLLWIDGGHSYRYVYSDLFHFGKHAKVIALHDYKNPLWPTVEDAIKIFIERDEDFYIHQIVDSVCILRRSK
jgi:predicted O-methyltransferase YrrM